MPQIASRVRSLGTETALDVLVKARAVEARGRSVIHLEVGEPDFPTPTHIVEAGVRALRDGKTRYGAPAGLPSLREAICQDLDLRGVRAPPDQVHGGGAFDRRVARDAGSHHPGRRVLESVRDDRLAAGLGSLSSRARATRGAADDQFEHLHRLLRPGSRAGGAARAAGGG